MGNEGLYLRATEELDNGRRDAAIWAKALALAHGNESEARYKYIQFRVEQMENLGLTNGDSMAEDFLNSHVDADSASSGPAVPPPTAAREIAAETDRGFIWWQVWGWLGLTVGNLLTLASLADAMEVAVPLVLINSVLMILVLSYNKYAFLVATVLSLNPIVWVINGIYLKRRWNHPKVKSATDIPGGRCERCGAKALVNYGDAYHTICKQCAAL